MLRHYWPQHLCAALALTYVVGAIAWTLPAGFPFKQQVANLYQPAFRYLGLHQDWSMFAPNPRQEDIYVSVRFYFANGPSLPVNLSRMSEMGYGERYRKERWRKFLNDNLRSDSMHALWQPFATWLIKTMQQESGLLVTKVELYRHWRVQPGPGVQADSPWLEHKFYELKKEP